MSLEDIEKLRVRVEKDPQSRLFLPLAEEYRKAGMLDEAISVLLSGLNRHPGYTSARVTLGKIYLELNRLQDAREEFEQVVTAVPDNLFGHRKLADIYREGGEQAKAVRQYQRVLQLNPLDEDARTCLEQLEGKATPAEPIQPLHQEEKAPAVEAAEMLTMDIEDLPAPEEAAVPGELPGTAAEVPVQAYEEFKSFFSDSSGRAYDEMSEAPREEPPGITLEETVEPEIIPEADEEIPAPPIDLAKTEQPAVPFEELDDLDYTEAVEETEEPAGAFEVAEEEAFSGLGELAEETLPGGEDEVSLLSDEIDEAYHGEMPVQELESDLAYADTFVSQGEYAKAMKIFQECLAKNPGNRHILQRISELKEFLKIIGKGEEVVIARLETFLAGIHRRKDEFFRNS